MRNILTKGAFLILSILLMISLFRNIKLETAESRLLVRAYSDSGYQLEETKLKVWSKGRIKYETIDELEKRVFNIADLLNLKDAEVSRINREDRKQVQIIKQTKETTTIINAVEMIEKVEGYLYRPWNYIIIEIQFKSKQNSIVYYEELISEYLMKQNKSVNKEIGVIGSKEGFVSREGAINQMRDILESLDCELVTENGSKEVLSLSGYSSNISSGVKLDEEWINVDVSFVWNEENNRTYLLLDTPSSH